MIIEKEGVGKPNIKKKLIMQSDLSSDGACSRVVKDLSDFCLSTGSRHTLGKNSGQVNTSSLEVHPSVANTGSTPLVSVQTRSQLKSILRNEDPANFNGKQRYSENPTPPENTQTVAQNDQSQTNQPQSVQLTREEWLHRAHAHPLAGHFGEQATLLRLKDFTSWPGMEQDVADLVRSCRCQLTKSYPRLKPSHGFSQSFHFCEKIGIDFLGPFPPTPRNNRYIFVLNEMLSNSLLAIPCTRSEEHTSELQS